MKNKFFSFVGILVIMLVFGMMVSGCATTGGPPTTFVRGQAGTATIMLRSGLEFDQAFREVSFILIQRGFMTETLQPEAGFIRTNWVTTHTVRGQTVDSYTVRVTITFNPSRTQVILNVDGRWRDNNGNWINGNDTAVTSDLRTELMMAVGN